MRKNSVMVKTTECHPDKLDPFPASDTNLQCDAGHVTYKKQK